MPFWGLKTIYLQCTRVHLSYKVPWFISPHLEYGTVACAPRTARNIKSWKEFSEGPHNSIRRTVKSEDDYYNRKERLNLLTLESIEGRCAIFVRNVLVNIDVFLYIIFIQIS